MSQIINRVVKQRWGNANVICVHRIEVGGYQDAMWLKFCCENPADTTVVAEMAHDPQLRAVVEAHLAKQLTYAPGT
jgi:hypothetical protein